MSHQESGGSLDIAIYRDPTTVAYSWPRISCPKGFFKGLLSKAFRGMVISCSREGGIHTVGLAEERMRQRPMVCDFIFNVTV
jgi:hypothetical protein